MSKVIFLDIDSVLNNQYSHNRLRLDRFDPSIRIFSHIPTFDYIDLELWQNLKFIINQTGAKVVGISSWFDPEDNEHNKAVMNFLEVEPFEVPVVDSTGGGPLRYGFVLRFLAHHQSIVDWVVIDDIPDTLGLIQGRHIQPTGLGLTKELAQKAIGILNAH